MNSPAKVNSQDVHKLMQILNRTMVMLAYSLESRLTPAEEELLDEAHIKELNQIVSAYLDLAENRAKRQIIMKMEDWVNFLHDFLKLSNYPILEDKGKVSALEAKIKAEQEFEVYREIQDKNYLSDFDKEVKRIMGKNGE